MAERTWQPRETAPRDRTLLVVVARRDGERMFDGNYAVVHPAYIDEDGNFCDCGSWNPDSGLDGRHYVVTHWMPLPEPPEVPHA